jgi:hypothetical protein
MSYGKHRYRNMYKREQHHLPLFYLLKELDDDIAWELYEWDRRNSIWFDNMNGRPCCMGEYHHLKILQFVHNLGLKEAKGWLEQEGWL